MSARCLTKVRVWSEVVFPLH